LPANFCEIDVFYTAFYFYLDVLNFFFDYFWTCANDKLVGVIECEFNGAFLAYLAV